jgi:hypothetical protein
MSEHSNGHTRREFLKTSGALAGTGLLGWPLESLAFRPDIDNPLAHYPARDWEKVYRVLPASPWVS